MLRVLPILNEWHGTELGATLLGLLETSLFPRTQCGIPRRFLHEGPSVIGVAKIEEEFNISAIDTVSWLVASIGYIIFSVIAKQARVLRTQPHSCVDSDSILT